MNTGCTCIIPLYNEQDRILSVVKKLSSLTQIDKFILVDDGSTDKSKTIIQQYCDKQSDDRIQFITYPKNTGKSFAVWTGLQEVQTEYVLLFDADLSNIVITDVAMMIESMYADKRIDMGILRRISSGWYIKLFYRELILSGQRMLKTKDLQEAFKSHPINRYQLEVALNMYMKHHKKTTVRYPFSAENTYKHHKRGFRYGWKRDMLMFRDIFAYHGFRSFSKHIFFFRPQSIAKYQQSHQ